MSLEMYAQFIAQEESSMLATTIICLPLRSLRL